jgi:uncharacterized protein (TIGR02145 family)
MKKKNSVLILPLIIIGVSLMLTNRCKKDDNNSLSDLTNGRTTAVFNPSKTYGSLTDQEGNVYRTIKIGTQTWMAENLRTTKYRNGEAIPEITDNWDWTDCTTGAYCNYNNTRNNDTIATYGRLYNWYAVNDNRKIAPAGWHIPSDEDWTTLINFLDTTGLGWVAGGKLKETDTIHWNSPNTGATNESGFTALPGGDRSDLIFFGIGYDGEWWSSTEYGTGPAYWFIDWFDNNVFPSVTGKYYDGFSVRCVMDN